jgi:hypothetical protein
MEKEFHLGAPVGQLKKFVGYVYIWKPMHENGVIMPYIWALLSSLFEILRDILGT